MPDTEVLDIKVKVDDKDVVRFGKNVNKIWKQMSSTGKIKVNQEISTTEKIKQTITQNYKESVLVGELERREYKKLKETGYQEKVKHWSGEKLKREIDTIGQEHYWKKEQEKRDKERRREEKEGVKRSKRALKVHEHSDGVLNNLFKIWLRWRPGSGLYGGVQGADIFKAIKNLREGAPLVTGGKGLFGTIFGGAAAGTATGMAAAPIGAGNATVGYTTTAAATTAPVLTGAGGSSAGFSFGTASAAGAGTMAAGGAAIAAPEIALIIVAVMAVVGVLFLIYKAVKFIVKTMLNSQAVQMTKDYLAGPIESMMAILVIGFITYILTPLQQMWTALQGLFSGEGLKGLFNSLTDIKTEDIQKIIMSINNFLFEAFKKGVAFFIEWLIFKFKMTIELITSYFTVWLAGIKAQIEIIYAFIVYLWNSAVLTIKTMMNLVIAPFRMIYGIVEAIVNFIGALLSGKSLKDAFKSLLGDITRSIVQLGEDVISTVTTFLQKAFWNISQLIADVLRAPAKFIDSLIKEAGRFVQALIDNLKEMWTNVTGGASDILGNIGTGRNIGKLWDTVI